MPTELQSGQKLGSALDDHLFLASTRAVQEDSESDESINELGVEARNDAQLRIANDQAGVDKTMEEELLRKVKVLRLKNLLKENTAKRQDQQEALKASNRIPQKTAEKVEADFAQKQKQKSSVQDSAPRFNFAAASSRDDVLFFADTPALPLGDEAIGEEEGAEAWVEQAKARGVTRVVSLVDDKQLAWWLTQVMGTHFDLAVNVPLRSPGAAERVRCLVAEAQAAGERILLHCPPAPGRSGRVTGAWLVERYGVCPSAAMAETLAHARECGVQRSGDAQMLARYLEAGREAWRGDGPPRKVEAAPFNCAPATKRAVHVHAARAPGVKAGCTPAPGSITEDDVAEWAAHVKAQRVTRVLSLLNHDELAWYGGPGLMAMLRGHFGRARCEQVDLGRWDAWERIRQLLVEAEAGGERVVVHCPQGTDRSGRVLGAWLMARHGLAAPAAAAEVVAHAATRGAERRVDLQMMARFVDVGYESWRPDATHAPRETETQEEDEASS